MCNADVKNLMQEVQIVKLNQQKLSTELQKVKKTAVQNLQELQNDVEKMKEINMEALNKKEGELKMSFADIM